MKHRAQRLKDDLIRIRAEQPLSAELPDIVDALQQPVDNNVQQIKTGCLWLVEAIAHD